MRRWSFLLVAASGCTQFYDITETTLAPEPPVEDFDLDDDGLLDVVDSCPAIANPLQEDADSDGIGDACDACPTGSNHNEDGDGALDGCDNCPHLANEDQANSDGDDLGDSCDDAQTTQRRARFDGFGELEIDWIPGVAEWQVTDDVASPLTRPSDFDHGLWNRRIEVNGLPWVIETRVTLPMANGTFAGLQTHYSVGTIQDICYVLYTTSGGWTLNTDGATMALPPQSGPIRLQLRGAGTTVRCEVPGVAAAVSTNTLLARTHPGLRANTIQARFEYIDAIYTPVP